MKKRVGVTIALIAAIVVVGAMTLTLVRNKQTIDSRKEVKVAQTDVAVTVATAEVRPTGSTLNLVGTAKASKEVVVASEAAGKITRVNFKLGDHVSKGAVLATIDDTYKLLTLENAQLNRDKFKEDYDRYVVLRAGDAVTEVQLRDMKVGLEDAEIKLRNAKKQMEDTKITAPFSGVITSKDTELGAYINVGNAIAGMADIAQLQVSLAVSESNVYNLHQGQDVNVTAAVYPGVDYRGKISNISPQGSSSHTYPVEIMIPNSTKNPLKAGTYVNIEIDMDKSGSVLMVPRDAIVSSVKDPSVYVVRDNTAHLTKIVTGQDHGAYIEVTSGLQEGDLVVTNGQINLTDGSKVSITNN